MEAIVQKQEGSYLTFALGREEYGVEVRRVREIIAPAVMEVVPGLAPHIRGILRLRGKVVPVLDLRRRFGLEETETRGDYCVVTVLAKGWEGSFLMGLLVDGIREVIQVDVQNLEKTSMAEEDPREEFLRGLAQCQDRVVLLLDVDKVAQDEEVEEIGKG